MRTQRILAAALSLGLLGLSPAQANPSDWESPEAMVEALYEVISADAGEARDWDRFRDLFLEDAQLSMAMDSRIGSGIMALGIEDLIAQTDSAYAATGFHETGLALRVERYGQLASVMSSFEVRLRRSDAEPLMRGLNHFQLLNDGERWWIVSNVGVIESPQQPLPPEYQPAAAEEGKP